MKAILFALICFLPLASYAQKDAPLSAPDSIRLRRYKDTLNHTRLFSYKRQQYWDSALSVCPHKAYYWQQKGMPLLKQHKYELALPSLDSAVKYDPVAYTEYRAFCKCIFIKSYRSAITDFEAAERISPGAGVMDHTYDFYKGLCYLQLDMFDSAYYCIQKSIAGQQKAHGESWVHYIELFYLGIVYYEKGDLQNAIASFDKSLLQYKRFSDAKYYKALCLVQLHRNKEALTTILEAADDLKEGYTINEDNVYYEIYPYQINQGFYMRFAIEEIQLLNEDDSKKR